MPWRRRGGCGPAPAAAPPRFRLLFRHPVGSSPIGQFKPRREPLRFRHLGPAPGVTEMPRPARSSARFRATLPVTMETRDATSGPCPGATHSSRPGYPLSAIFTPPLVLLESQNSEERHSSNPFPLVRFRKEGSETGHGTSSWPGLRPASRNPAASPLCCGCRDGAGRCTPPGLSPSHIACLRLNRRKGPSSPRSSLPSCTLNAAVCTDLL